MNEWLDIGKLMRDKGDYVHTRTSQPAQAFDTLGSEVSLFYNALMSW